MTRLTKISIPKQVLSVAPSFKPPPQNPDAFKFPSTTPLHLTASTTIQSNSSGGVNAISLKNPLGQAMEILEIKWQLFQSVQSIANVGGVIGCKLDLGRFPLTNGYVPVWSFGRATNLFGEMMSDSDNKCVNEFAWKLPRPLYVPANAVVVPTFQHRGLVTQDIQVRVSYSARSVPTKLPAPKKIALPYAAFYASKGLNYNDSGTDNSLETDLVNPFDEPLVLQRFTGRTQSAYLSLNQVFDAYTLPSVGAIQYNVRLVDSFGRQVIQNFVPFGLAFSGVTRSWEVDGATMDPRSYVLAYLRKDVPFQGLSNDNIITQAFVGLVGHRIIDFGGL